MAAPRTIDEYIAGFPPKVRAILRNVRATVQKAALKKALAPYAGAKGNLRFPYDRPIPYGLIRKIVKLRAKQNLAKAAAKRKRT